MSVRVGLILSAACALSFCAAGCSDGECNENRNSLPYAGFYSSDKPTQEISLDSVSVFGIGAPGGSFLADSVSGLSRVYLPFKINAYTSSFVFRYENRNAPRPDTVSFFYSPEAYFVSDACGAVYRFHVMAATTTHNAIDSVVCPRNIIDNTAGVNIRIYFRTAEAANSTSGQNSL